MTRRMITAALTGVAIFALSGAPASASPWNKKTYLTVNKTIEVPGAVLQPGEYVMKLVDSDSNRHIVQFLNEDENKVLSTVIAIPNQRLQPTGDTEFAWYETPAGQPPAMRAWFFPGDSFGQEFAYPEGRAATLAASTQRNVMQTPRSTTPVVRETEVTVVTPQRETSDDYASAFEQNQTVDRDNPYNVEDDYAIARQRTDAQEQTQIAQAQPAPRPQPRVTEQPAARPAPMPQNEPQQNELPQTAGFGALLALLGLGSLGASAAVRKVRKS